MGMRRLRLSHYLVSTTTWQVVLAKLLMKLLVIQILNETWLLSCKTKSGRKSNQNRKDALIK